MSDTSAAEQIKESAIDPNRSGPGSSAGLPSGEGTQEIEINGKKLTLPKSTVEAILSDRKDANDKVSSAEEELRLAKEEAAKTVARKEPQDQSKQEDPFDQVDWDKLIFENPKEAMRELYNITRRDTTADLTGRYNRANTEKQFWDQFYDSNNDLKSEKMIVDAVLQRNMSALGPMDREKAADKIAELTRKELLRISNKMKKSAKKPDGSTTLEGTSLSKLGLEEGDKDKDKDSEGEQKNTAEIFTLSSVLKERREKRRKARLGTT